MSQRRLARRLGYEFQDPDLFQRALTHRSAGGVNNERLEFLGDAVLGAVIAEWLFRQLPDASEGQLTRYRSSLVKGTTLAQVANQLEVGECLRLGGGERKSGGHRRDSILADALEALIGAMYLEGGMALCRERVLDWFDELLEPARLEAETKDAKTRLQELLQGLGLPLPTYSVVSTEGDPHNQSFTVACEVDGLEPVRAKDTSRKKAEKKAAAQALKALLERHG